MARTRSSHPVGIGVVALGLVAGTLALIGATSRPATGATSGVSKVLWISEENTSPADILATAPVAPSCRTSTRSRPPTARPRTPVGCRAPASPNYIAATSGGTQGVADDLAATEASVELCPNLFSQLPAGLGESVRPEHDE